MLAPVVVRHTKAQHILLLLDFDGTLAPLRDRPEDVRLVERGYVPLLWYPLRMSREKPVTKANLISDQ